MRIFLCGLLILGCLPAMAQQTSYGKLSQLVKSGSPELKTALPAAMGDDNLKKGTAYLGEGSDFLFALETSSAPKLIIDEAPGGAMKSVKGSSLWVGSGQLKTGTVHSFSYLVDGKPFGGKTDV